MADIQLRLISDNEQYISGIKEAQNAQQSLNDNFKVGEKDKVNLINGTVKALSDEEKALQVINSTVTKTGGSLKSQISQMRTALSQIEQAGLEGTKAFRDLSIRAGELADQAGDTAQQIKILSSDTKHLDAAMSIGTGLAGGFAIAEGSMALFGAESQNLQKQLVKLQAGMNLLNGLQSVANVLNKDSAARVVLAAKAQQLYTMVVGTSTGALRAFKLALAATGIGLIVVAIGLLVENWDKLTSSIFGSNDELDKFDKNIKEIENSIYTLNSVIAENIQKRNDEIAILGAIGGEEEEIYKKRLENFQDEKRLLAEQIALTEENLKKQQLITDLAYINSGKNSKEYEEELNKLRELGSALDEQKIKYGSIDSQVELLAINEKNRIDKAIKQNADLLREKVNAAKQTQLTGKARVNFEEKLALEEIDILEKNLEKTYELTEDQYKQLDYLRKIVSKNAQKERDKIDKENFDKAVEADVKLLEEKQQHNDKIKELQRKIEEDQLELIGASEVDKLLLKQKFLEEDIKALEAKGDEESKLIAESLRIQSGIIQNELDNSLTTKGKSFSIWRLLGIDSESEQGKAAIESLKNSFSIIKDQISQVMDAEVQQAEQHTQLVEQRLDEAENQLDKELELQKGGYANNVDAKRREIAQLKLERAKALEQEKKAKQAQFLLDSAEQLSSLITAGANIWKTSTVLGPIVGPIIAIATIATMFGSFAAAKLKASEAINSKLEQGGSGDSNGIINGNRHAQGGEKFSDHIEVEQGERWAVWNRSASQKYGKFIPELVDSMNSLKFPNIDFKGGQTVVNVKTKKMESELESINSGIRTLNENISNNSDMFYVGKTRIVKLSNNHIRIIHGKN